MIQWIDEHEAGVRVSPNDDGTMEVEIFLGDETLSLSIRPEDGERAEAKIRARMGEESGGCAMAKVDSATLRTYRETESTPE